MAGGDVPPEPILLIPSQVAVNNSIRCFRQQRLARYFQSAGTQPHPPPLSADPFRPVPTATPSPPPPLGPNSSLPWGDYHLPGAAVHEAGIFRVYSQNVNGLSTANNNLEAMDFAKVMACKAVAVAGIQETNRNFERLSVKESFHACLRSVSTHHQGEVSSAHLQFQSDYQPGGTAVSVMNKWATRFLAKGSDSYGRWSWLTLVGSGTLKITFISAYRVCDGASFVNPDSSTVRSQQHWLYASQGFSTVDLRRQFDLDLRSLVSQFQASGHDIVLMMDANQPDGVASTCDSLCKLCNLTSAHSLATDPTPLPATFARGSAQIDFVLISGRLVHAVRAASILPLQEGVISDHRALVVDFDEAALFSSKTTEILPPCARRLTSTQPKAVHIYIANMLAFVAKHNIVARVNALCEQSDSGVWTPADVAEWEVIDHLLSQGRSESENKCPPKHSGRFPWSPELDRAGKLLSYWRLRIGQCRSGACNNSRLLELQTSLAILADHSRPLPLTRLFYEAQKAKKQFALVKRSSVEKRRQHLEDMGRFAGVVHRWAPQAAIRRIQASELSSQQFRQLRSIFRGGQSSGFDRLDIPDSTAVLRQDENIPRISLVVQEQIEEVLLPHTVRRFRQHDETPFGHGNRGARLGRDCTSHDACAISDGSYDYRLIELSEEARSWLQQLKTRDFVAREGAIGTRVSTEEWVCGWNRMSESTASAPGSGHYGHYKTASLAARLPVDHEDHTKVLATLYASMWSLPLLHGFSPKRWQSCVDAILEKIPGKPMLEKLRIIMLYEADFNYVLKLVWGKKLVQNAEKHQSLGECNHGSRAGRQTHNALLQKLLLYEQARLSRSSLITVDNDAKSCYDRIIKTLGLLACICFGLPILAAKMHNDTHDAMQHSIRSRHGLFRPYGGSASSQLEGSGQGSGASPAIWLLLCTTLLQAFQGYTKGMEIVFPFESTVLSILAIFYVDDGTPGVNDVTRHSAESLRLLLKRAQNSAQSWERLLFASGGALEFSKCFTYTIYWDLSGGKHRLLSPSELPGCEWNGEQWVGPISLTYGSTSDASHKLVSESPWHGRRTLGVRLAPAGGWKDEFQFRLQQSRDLARRLSSAQISKATARLAYRMLICPKLEYPLTVTQFSQDECARLSSPVVCTALSCMGFNQHMPRSIVFGPPSLGGIGMHDLYVEQGIKHLSSLLGHIRQGGTTGSLMLAQLQWCQIQAGCGFPLLSTPAIPIDYIEDCWLMCIRDFLCTFQLRLQFARLPKIELLCDHDEFIMDALRTRGNCSYLQLQRLNACRMWLRVSRLSEITTLDGTQLYPGPKEGVAPTQFPSSLKWPRQGYPEPKDWNLWFTKLRFVFSSNGRSLQLRRNLGKWRHNFIVPSEWQTVAHHASGGVTVFFLNKDGSVRCTGTAAGMRGGVRIHQPQATAAVLPASIVPVTLVTSRPDHPPRLLMRGSHSPAASLVQIPGNFWEFIQLQPPHIHSLLGNCSTDEDSAQKLLARLLHSAYVDAGADGGLVQDVGTFGFVLGDSSTGLIVIEGNGRVPGGAFPISSTRSELCGVLACLSYLRLLLAYAEVPPTQKLGCTLYCDSQAALARIKDLQYKRFGTTWRCRENYDIEAAISQCLDNMAVKMKFCWVRGHALQRQKHGSSLSWDEILNEAADALATRARNIPIDATNPIWPEQQVWLANNDGVINGRLDQDLRYHCTAPDVLAYWGKKFAWSNSVVTSIEMDGTSRSLKKLPVPVAARICKLRCGWLPVNEREAMIDPDRQPGCSSCSSVGLCLETVDHLFQCPSACRVSHLGQKFANFKPLLESLGTAKYLSRALRVGMLCWMKGRIPPDVSAFHLPATPLGRMVARAYIQQGNIGWNMAFRGFLTHSWKSAQAIHSAQIKSRRDMDGTAWTASVVSWTFSFFESVWTQRNAEEFGTDFEDIRRKKLVLCERSIRRLFIAGQELPANERYPFQTEMSTILSRRLPLQEQWITNTERFLPGALKRVANRTKNGQKAITEFFTRKNSNGNEVQVVLEAAASGVT